MLYNVLQWLEDSSIAVAIRRSAWLYPALEIVHIIGIVVLVGPALMFDLRLLGFSKFVPVLSLGDYLLKWSRRGLIFVVPSGLFLFITNSTTLAYNPVFWMKMLLLVMAGLNALLFHRFTREELLNSSDVSMPAKAKFAAIVSITSWLMIIACGRLLAY